MLLNLWGMIMWAPGFLKTMLNPFAVLWPPYSIRFVDILICQHPRSDMLLLYLRGAQDLTQDNISPLQLCLLSHAFMKNCWWHNWDGVLIFIFSRNSWDLWKALVHQIPVYYLFPLYLQPLINELRLDW